MKMYVELVSNIDYIITNIIFGVFYEKVADRDTNF